MQIDNVNFGMYQTSPEVYEDGVAVSVVFSLEEISYLKAQYDSTSSTSPSVTLTRPIVRAMLDAVIAKES